MNMRTSLILLALPLLVAAETRNKDLGFRFKDGACVNSKGEKGLNPSFLGQCGDFAGAKLANLDLSEIDFSGSRFVNADLQLSKFDDTTLVNVDFQGAKLSGVGFSGAVIRNANFKGSSLKNVLFGGAEIIESDFTNVDLSMSALSYVRFEGCGLEGAKFNGSTLDGAEFNRAQLKGANFAGANLQKAQLDDARIAQADFSGANLTQASLRRVKGEGVKFGRAILRNADLANAELKGAGFRGVKMEGAILSSADLEKSDLRSASLENAKIDGTRFADALINNRTLLSISMDEAQRLGMTLKGGANVLIIWDQKSADLDALVKALNEMDVETTLSTTASAQFTGEKISEYNAALHIGGQDGGGNDMPTTGQMAIVQFVKDGGTFVDMEWSAFKFQFAGRFQLMREVIVYDRVDGFFGDVTLKVVPEQVTHPILDGIPAQFVTRSGYSPSKMHDFGDKSTMVLMKDLGNNDVVVTRTLGEGNVVGISLAMTYPGSTALKSPEIQKLLANALNWE